MLNELLKMIRRYDLLHPGDRLFCAVSGGSDSMALLWGMYLLQEKLKIQVEAVHFNHHLRAQESDRDQQFVEAFCKQHDIPLTMGGDFVIAGAKGLESAARDARYIFLRKLPGMVATAHTADDNAETVLLHLVRGTGLKGLGGITPQSGNIIRPMLSVTRTQVESFLTEYHIPHIEDSSNASDQFLRNRIRHHVIPLLKDENPRLAENLSEMALRLRMDEEALEGLTPVQQASDVYALRRMHSSQRARALEYFLKQCGIQEPEGAHIALAESLVFSEKPSARADFPGNITIRRRYHQLVRLQTQQTLQPVKLCCPGITEIPQLRLRVRCTEASEIQNTPEVFTVNPQGSMILRYRMAGDVLSLRGGTKKLKKIFIDRKIPEDERNKIPVVTDDAGILGVYGIGPDQNRIVNMLPGIQISFERMIIPNGIDG